MAIFYGILDFNDLSPEALTMQLERMRRVESPVRGSETVRFLFASVAAAVHPPAYLGHGTQDYFFRNERFTVLFEGEVFNRLSLAKGLGLKSPHADRAALPDLIARGFRIHGPTIFNQLDGSFRLVIWDALQETFYLVGDRFGLRPLYFSAAENRLVFASEIRRVLSVLNSRPNLDRQAIVDFVSFGQLLDERTFFENLAVIPAGHYLKVKRDQAALSSYSETSDPGGLIHGQQEAIGLLRNTLMLSLKNLAEQGSLGFEVDCIEAEVLLAALDRLGCSPHQFRIEVDQIDSRMNSEVSMGPEESFTTTLTPARFFKNFRATVLLGEGLINGLHGRILTHLPRLREQPCIWVSSMHPLSTAVTANEFNALKEAPTTKTGMMVMAVRTFDHLYLPSDWLSFLYKPSPLQAGMQTQTLDAVERLLQMFESVKPAEQSMLRTMSEIHVRTRLRRFHALIFNLLRPYVPVAMPYFSFSFHSLTRQLPEQWLTAEKELLHKILRNLHPGGLHVPVTPPKWRSSRRWHDIIRHGAHWFSWQRREAKPQNASHPFDVWLKRDAATRRRVQTYLLDLLVEDIFGRKDVQRLLYQHYTGRADHRDLLGRIMTINLWHKRFIRDLDAGEVHAETEEMKA